MNGSSVTKEAKVAEFLHSPLVKWIRTFEDLAPCDSMATLADAELLTRIMQEVDPSSVSLAKINRKVSGDRMRRAQNLHYLLESMMNFYASSLQQVIIMRLPDMLAICKDPENDESLYELEKLLLLLLGCTVQCENKEVMIQQIQRLETSVQHAVVSHIKEVTDNPDVVFAFEWEDIEAMSKARLEAECRRMYLYLQKLAKERDEYQLARIDLSHERDFYLEQYSLAANVKQNLSRTPSFLKSPPQQGDIDSQHIRELKKKVRLQQEQLDSKTSQLQESQEELEKHKEQVQRLHQEKRHLSKDAQKVRVYKDEVEVLRAKVSDFDQFQTENKKLRDRAEDIDYLKKKLRDLKEQNGLLQESKQLLEEEMASMTLKYQATSERERDITKLKMQVDSLQAAKDADLQQIQELIESNTRLEFEKRHMEDEFGPLRKELEDLKMQLVSGGDNKPSFEIERTEEEISARTKLLRLERDNKQLERTLEELRESSSRVISLEINNKELHSQLQENQKQLIHLQEESNVERMKAQTLGKEKAQLIGDFQRLGIDHEKTLAGMKSMEREKFGVIEARIDAALNRSVCFDEERMTVLESRLEESSETNRQLTESVEKLQRENVRLKTTATLTGPGGHHTMGPSLSSSSSIGAGGSITGGLLESAGSLSGASSQDGSHETSPAIERKWDPSMALNSTGGSTESPRFHHQGRRSEKGQHQHQLQQQQHYQQQQPGGPSSSPMLLHFREGLAVRDFAYLQDKILDLRGEKAGLEGEVAEWKSRMNRLEQGKADVEMKRKAEVTTRDAEIRSLQRQLQDLEIFRVEVEIRRNEVSQLNRELAQLRRRMHEAESARTEIEVRQHSVSSAKMAEVKSLRRQLDELCQINHDLETIQDTMTEKCIMLDQMNKTLEQENKHLLAQLSSLVLQNRDLMARNIESNDKYHVGEKQFHERLTGLVSEKQRLRDKLEALEAEKNRKKKGFFSRMKGKFKAKHSRSEDKPPGTTTIDGVSRITTSESTTSLGNRAVSFSTLPDAGLADQPQGTRASIAYGQMASADSSGRQHGELLSPISGDGSARSRYSIATARPTDRSSGGGGASPYDHVLALEDFLKESNKTPNSRRRYIEEMLSTLQTPYRDRSASGGGGTDGNVGAGKDEIFPRRELMPGESPPSFLKISPQKKRSADGSAASRTLSSPVSPPGTLQREHSSDALMLTAVDRPKARRRMQSTDALLGGRSSFTPPRLEPVPLSDDDGSAPVKRTVPRERRRARTMDSAQWAAELKSPTRKSVGSGGIASQERQPSDGAPAEETVMEEKQQRSDGGESPMHRSQARATLASVSTPKGAVHLRHPGVVRSTSDPRRRSGGSSDNDSGIAPSANRAAARMSSPVGSVGMQPVYQSTPIRKADERPKSDVRVSSSEDDIGGKRSPDGGNKEDAAGKAEQVTSPVKSESGMDNSGWYEYGCV
eukprot:m.22136 g.22136  ORF g.22136 m.22136 type:complete len:1449 (+) comp28286_c0_seq4:324-4670(+)